MDLRTIENHPVVNLFPRMFGDELVDFNDDVKKHGIKCPIVVWNNLLIDGRHRKDAAIEHNVECPVTFFEGNEEEAIALSWSLNGQRRNLTASRKALAAAESMALFREIATKRRVSGGLAQNCAKGKAAEQAAKLAGVSTRTVEIASKVLNESPAEVVEAIRSGTVKVSDAASVATEPPAVQRKAVAAVGSGKANTLREAVQKPSKNGKPVFDDRIVESLIGKLVRAFDSRAAAHGKEKGFKDCEKQLELLEAAWKRWQIETTGAKR